MKNDAFLDRIITTYLGINWKNEYNITLNLAKYEFCEKITPSWLMYECHPSKYGELWSYSFSFFCFWDNK